VIRVLYATPFVAERSGPEESLLALLGSDPFRGAVEPVVALPPTSPYRPRFEAAGVATVPYEADLLQRTYSPVAGGRWLVSVRRAAEAARGIIRSVRPDLAPSNMESMLGLAIAARHAGIPHVHHVRSLSINRPAIAGRALLRFIADRSAAQIAISPEVAALFGGRGHPVVVENPVAPALFDLPVVHRSGRPAVVALGRISPRKQLDLVIDVAARSSVPATFLIVGPTAPADAGYEAHLRARAAERCPDGRVRFEPARDAAEVLGDADVLLHACGEEGFGRVVAEAMAAGVAVVVRRDGATGGLVDDGRTGLVFSTADEGAAAVDRLLAHPGERDAIAAAARAAAAARFSSDVAAASVLAVYGRVLSSTEAR
jgi:glycosyltransferase involved in cell wall biosynthesis